jgi:hypothetical protein
MMWIVRTRALVERTYLIEASDSATAVKQMRESADPVEAIDVYEHLEFVSANLTAR